MEIRSIFKNSAIGWIIYFLVIFGLIYGIPRVLSYALKTPYPMAAITSGSMWPELKKGDLVFIKGIKDRSEIKMGDIVVYKNEKGFTIHRVIDIRTDKVITKGDANSISDPPVKYEEVVGKTLDFNNKPLKIPLVGNISIMSNKNKL